MPPNPDADRLWETAKQVAETHAMTQNIEKRLDNLPCIEHADRIRSQGEDLAAARAKTTGIAAVVSVVGTALATGALAMLKVLGK